MASSSSLLLSIFVVGLFLVPIEVDGSPRVAFSKFTRGHSENIPDAGTPAPIVPTPVKPTFKHLTSQYGVRSNPPPSILWEDEFHKFSENSFVEAEKAYHRESPLEDEELDEKIHETPHSSFIPEKQKCAGLSCTDRTENHMYYSEVARMTNMFSQPSSVPPFKATMTKEQLSENEMALYYESIRGQTPEIVGTQQNIPPPPPLITTFDSMNAYYKYKARSRNPATFDEDLAHSDP